MSTLVTLSTDGLRDYVGLPNGQKLILGTITVLKFITKLNLHSRLNRTLLDAFNEHGEVMVTVDLPSMYDLLGSSRSKWAKNDFPTSLISASDRTLQVRTRIPMDVKTLQTRIAAIEEVVSSLLSTGDRFNAIPKIETLKTLSANLAVPDTVEPVAAVIPVSTPSVDSLQSNSTLADEILFKVEATAEKIDQLVTAGRKFNASVARADLYGIANRVAEILNNVDIAQPWVGQDLTGLAQEANHIYSLFEPAKV